MLWVGLVRQAQPGLREAQASDRLSLRAARLRVRALLRLWGLQSVPEERLALAGPRARLMEEFFARFERELAGE